MYITLGGGYCIGLLCELHFLPFSFHQKLSSKKTAIFAGIIFIVLFYRHQSFLCFKSIFKLKDVACHATATVLMLGINVLPLFY
ncbi:hypothetical protein PFISCL1PPCAC_14132, partial [Pristionchus fissidentatus]